MDEKQSLDRFHDELRRGVTITGKAIENHINESPCLKNRTVAQVRTYLHTIKKKLHCEPKESHGNRRNSVPTAIYTTFEHQIRQQSDITM